MAGIWLFLTSSGMPACLEYPQERRELMLQDNKIPGIQDTSCRSPKKERIMMAPTCRFINFLSLKFTNLNRGEEKKYYKLREDSKG